MQSSISHLQTKFAEAYLTNMGSITLLLLGLFAVTLSATAFSAKATTKLTDRQLQFWEDVEEGLLDIERYWSKAKSQNIDRIWKFTQRCERL